MSITTKRGDQGKTSFSKEKKVVKHHPIIKLIGELDELQALIGLFKTKLKKRKLLADQETLQQQLYSIMADIVQTKALDNSKYHSFLTQLEIKQAQLEKKIQIKRHFVLPGKNETEAYCHLVRVKVRAIERTFSQYLSKYPYLKKSVPFLNRLSDYYFVLSQSL